MLSKAFSLKTVLSELRTGSTSCGMTKRHGFNIPVIKMAKRYRGHSFLPSMCLAVFTNFVIVACIKLHRYHAQVAEKSNGAVTQITSDHTMRSHIPSKSVFSPLQMDREQTQPKLCLNLKR